MKRIIYLSPHLDDAVLSCGAIIWDQVHQGNNRVEVWTVCAGDAPGGELPPFARMLHLRWQTAASAPAARRSEDDLACAQLGCIPVHLDYPDCIYRRLPESGKPRVRKNDDLFRFDPIIDAPFIDDLSATLKQSLKAAGCILVVPLGVGGHIDHLITRAAAEKLNRPLWYYADYPYAGTHPEEIKSRTTAGMIPTHFAPSTDALQAWKQAIVAYRSQISTFWSSIEKMRKAIDAYSDSPDGNVLWKTVHPQQPQYL